MEIVLNVPIPCLQINNFDILGFGLFALSILHCNQKNQWFSF